jgi:hypothetical protein
MRRFFLSTVLLPALLLTTQCKPKAPENNEADASGMIGNYKTKWLRFFQRDVRHYVFFAGSDSKVGDFQCWYEAISNRSSSKRDPVFMRAESKLLYPKFLHIPTAQKLVENEKEILKNSGDPDATRKISLLDHGIKIMLNDKKDAKGKRMGVLASSHATEVITTEEQAKEFSDSIKAVITATTKPSKTAATEEMCLEAKNMEFF